MEPDWSCSRTDARRALCVDEVPHIGGAVVSARKRGDVPWKHCPRERPGRARSGAGAVLRARPVTHRRDSRRRIDCFRGMFPSAIGYVLRRNCLSRGRGYSDICWSGASRGTVSRARLAEPLRGGPEEHCSYPPRTRKGGYRDPRLAGEPDCSAESAGEQTFARPRAFPGPWSKRASALSAGTNGRNACDACPILVAMPFGIAPYASR